MTRFYTVPDAKTARRSVVWVMFLAGAFFACTTIFGLAAAHFVGQDAIRAADRGGNLTLPLLAQYLGGGKGSAGGEIMLGFIAAVAAATIIAVVAGLTLATSEAIAHDLYVNLIKKGNVPERAEVMAARMPSRPGEFQARSRDTSRGWQQSPHFQPIPSQEPGQADG